MQIVSQISRAMATGELAVGEKLPPIRELANDLVLNPNTVARAYGVLDQQGLVVTKAGAGTFVADPSLRRAHSGQVDALAQRADSVIAQGINLGMTVEDVEGLLQGRLKHFTKTSKEEPPA